MAVEDGCEHGDRIWVARTLLTVGGEDQVMRRRWISLGLDAGLLGTCDYYIFPARAIGNAYSSFL